MGLIVSKTDKLEKRIDELESDIKRRERGRDSDMEFLTSHIHSLANEVSSLKKQVECADLDTSTLADPPADDKCAENYTLGDVRELIKERDTLRDDVRCLKDELGVTQDSYKTLIDTYTEKTRENNKLKSEIGGLEARLHAGHNKFYMLKRENKRLRDALDVLSVYPTYKPGGPF